MDLSIIKIDKTLEIDINCDMGESYGNFKIGNDEAIFPFISSCNVACGFHGGDPYHIETTLKKALQYPIRIGAHPSYPDLQGFGRRKIQISKEELSAILKYQIAALKGMLESLGGRLSYVKPHGALYNEMAENEREAKTVIEAILSIDSHLALMGLAGSELEKWASEANIHFIPEAFVDRRYTAKGTLLSRSQPESTIQNPSEAFAQILYFIKNQKIISFTGEELSIKADTLCIHGDNPNAVAILQYMMENLANHQITLKKY